MALLEIIGGLLFVLSSGILFHERFRDNRFLLVVAGLVALGSSYFLFEEILARAVRSEIAKSGYTPSQPQPNNDTAAPAKKLDPPVLVAPVSAKEPVVAATPAPTDKTHLLEKIGDWSVFIYEDTGERVCFAASAPTDMQPKAATAKRTTVVFYVTAWKKDGVRNEISVKLGYATKPKSAVVVTAGGRSFTLPSGEDEKAYAKDPADEQMLLAAMSGGGSMVVKATSAKGTATIDQYSLEGLAAAVHKAQQACS